MHCVPIRILLLPVLLGMLFTFTTLPLQNYQKSGPNVRFCCLCRQWGRIACEDGQEESQSSRTTDAVLTALCCCWRGLLSGPSGGDTILYPRVARGRPVSTTGHRQPISVVAAAPQPPHIVTCDLSHYINARLNIAPTSVTVM